MKKSSFKLALAAIFCLSLGLRFWGLDRFADLVFDEVYFAKFAYNYLQQIPFFDNHPPLGKYCIALGMWLGQGIQALFNGTLQALGQPPPQPAITVAEGFRWLTWGYRWLNALTGALLPLVGAALAYELTQRRSYALISAFLLACDGLLLVESRHALINIYIMLFGLLGQWLFLRSLRCNREQGNQRHNGQKAALGFTGAGILLGSAIAVKWNGLGFILGLGGWWLVVSLGHGWQQLWSGLWQSLTVAIDRRLPAPSSRQPLFSPHLRRSPASPLASPNPAIAPNFRPQPTPKLENKLLKLHWSDLLLYLGIIPFLLYRLVWVPHLWLNREFSFWENQTQGLFSHASVGNGQEIHPYCSEWWSWPLLLRPVAYWYQTVEKAGKPWVYDIHAIGNPVLWWIAGLTVLFAAFILGHTIWRQVYGRIQAYLDAILTFIDQRSLLGYQLPLGRTPTPVPSLRSSASLPLTLAADDRQLLTYLLINLGANWFPWIGVSRCLFLYHYMAAAIYSFLILAWLLERWIRSSRPFLQLTAALILLGIVWGLLYWLPIYLGFPLEESAFRSRMWFRSWY